MADQRTMIDRALIFLRDQVNEHLARVFGRGDSGSSETIVFPDGDKLEPLALKSGAVNLLLVNMEQERVVRSGDPFKHMAADGSVFAVQPPIRLNLLLLFVARYRPYETALSSLSGVLRFFQAHRIFDTRDYPDLDPQIDRLTVELRTLPLHEQNDLWGSLRLAYHPSLLFHVQMLTVEQDTAEVPVMPLSDPIAEVAHAVPTGA